MISVVQPGDIGDVHSDYFVSAPLYLLFFRTMIYSMGDCYGAFWQLRRKEFRKAEGCMQARKSKIPGPGISDLLISCAVGDVHSGYFVSPPLGLYFLGR